MSVDSLLQVSCGLLVLATEIVASLTLSQVSSELGCQIDFFFGELHLITSCGLCRASLAPDKHIIAPVVFGVNPFRCIVENKAGIDPGWFCPASVTALR